MLKVQGTYTNDHRVRVTNISKQVQNGFLEETDAEGVVHQVSISFAPQQTRMLHADSINKLRNLIWIQIQK